MDKQLLFYKDFEFYPSTFSTLQDVPMWTSDSQKQSIWYKNIVSELLTKVPVFAILVRCFYLWIQLDAFILWIVSENVSKPMFLENFLLGAKLTPKQK